MFFVFRLKTMSFLNEPTGIISFNYSSSLRLFYVKNSLFTF